MKTIDLLLLLNVILLFFLFYLSFLIFYLKRKRKTKYKDSTLSLPSILIIITMLRSAVNSAQRLRHVVLFKFKDTASQADISKIENAFRALATTKVPQVRGFEAGTNVGKESSNQGFTHGFLLTFDSEQDRDTYMVHDDHKAFVQLQQGIVDKKVVVAFWGQ